MDATPSEHADFDAWVDSGSPTLERFVRAISTWFWDHVYRLQAHGLERLPVEGGYVLVPNHSSYADPFLHARPLQRPVRFMTKSTLFDVPLVGRIARGGGGFPVRRGKGDTFAMELAARLLQAGQVIVVYPEGTRFRDSAELGRGRSGAARLALAAGVPVVPVATWGVKRRGIYGRPWWRRPRATSIYGEPMSFEGVEDTPENVARVRDEIWARMQELYDEARQLDSER